MGVSGLTGVIGLNEVIGLTGVTGLTGITGLTGKCLTLSEAAAGGAMIDMTRGLDS